MLVDSQAFRYTQRLRTELEREFWIGSSTCRTRPGNRVWAVRHLNSRRDDTTSPGTISAWVCDEQSEGRVVPERRVHARVALDCCRVVEGDDDRVDETAPTSGFLGWLT
jgi:hypothetical protein